MEGKTVAELRAMKADRTIADNNTNLVTVKSLKDDLVTKKAALDLQIKAAEDAKNAVVAGDQGATWGTDIGGGAWPQYAAPLPAPLA